MKTIFNKIMIVALAISFAGCDFLETDYYRGIDVDSGLDNVTNIETAVTGAYYNLYTRYFAGNHAVNIGDIPTDITYWNTKTGHFDKLYQFTADQNDTYLFYIWEYGYKVVDNSARIIKASKALYDDATDDDKARLDICMAEAYALRAYANLIMVNVYAHQVKVNGNDFSSMPGLVISDEPVVPFSEISRSTVGETYNFILSDLSASLEHFKTVGGDRQDRCVFGVAAVYGLQARANLYLENWNAAKTAAAAALETAGIEELTYTEAAYKALYNGEGSNTESFFYLDINASQNWSSNSCGTLWTTYNFSPSPKLLSLYADTDVRKAIMGFDPSTTPENPVYGGGKYAAFGSGNPAYATCYLVNAPEMYLIEAEAALQGNDLTGAKNALLTVAKRNTAIAGVGDLPSSKAELLAFIKDERARELFQEGLRLWDLRRWGDKVSVNAIAAPAIEFGVKDYQISDLVYPIPDDEINAGFGVEQNEGWAKTLPAK